MISRSVRQSLTAAVLLAWAPPAAAAVVEEVTKLYPVEVERVARPRTVEEVQNLVRSHPGPVSIGGGRFSMGGQTATEGALQIDMRGLNRVLEVDAKRRLLIVQAGATWRSIIERIDPLGLSVKIMQSYANFTVGGSLGVNCHGRYVNLGPLIRSVRSIRIVLADGRLVDASPSNNPDIYFGAIGGYGALGVIVEATLELADNEPLERTARQMPIEEYPDYFRTRIRNSTSAVFHNGDIYPPDYERVSAITFARTSRAVTTADRFQPPYRPNWKDSLLQWWVSERDYAKRLRERAFEPLRLRFQPVVWRNYEATYDVAELEPYSREDSTYVLQEYFIPVARFGEFVPRMRDVFRRHHVNVLNVSIRHAKKDTGSLLAWAREECFAFVVYYKQGTARHERTAVGVWTRELVKAALASGGTYYLPYQWHAADTQFHRAYPRAREFFALKKHLDPGYKFRNKLWDRYLPAPTGSAPSQAGIRARLAARKDWTRPEVQSFLVLPEWDIVYGADELAAHIKDGRPSRFPFFAAVSRFWSVDAAVRKAVAGVYPPNRGYRLMVAVIGVCYTLEYGLKGLYEKTVGRLFERSGPPLPAELALQKGAADYAAFLRDLPWYEFPFGAARRSFLADSKAGEWSLRKSERRVYGTLQFALMGAAAKVIKMATGAAYAPEDLRLRAWVRPGRGAVETLAPGVKVLERLGPEDVLIEMPRYEKFQAALLALVKGGVRFVEISGARRIVLTVTAPPGWEGARLWDGELGSWPVFSGAGLRRFALAVPVARLHQALNELPSQGARIEHVYDY
jgi:FAD/FMN-containing dehydrogenase